MKLKIITVSFFIILTSAFQASADTLTSGSIDFYAIGKPSMLKIHGESTKLTGTITRKGNVFSGQFEIPLDSFETGMSVRNKHLKEKVFETSKYDKAKLTITELKIPDEKTGEIKELPFTGKLSLHGVEKDITGTAALNVTDKLITFSTEAEIKMSDYQIPLPEFMGMTMQDQVKILTKGEAKP
jgi:polyisoprenoid-binding protein YceI